MPKHLHQDIIGGVILAVAVVTGLLTYAAAARFKTADSKELVIGFTVVLPVAFVATLGQLWWTRRHATPARKRTAPLLGAVLTRFIICVAFVWLTSGLTLWLNALIGRQVPCVVEGQIVQMKRGSNRGAGPRVVVAVENGDEDVTLPVTRAEFQTLQIGDTYRREMFRGCLGIRYTTGRR